MKFGSLFSGIGGFDLGLERAGMIPEWQVEIDPYATKVLEKHWPNVKRYSDIRDCGSHNLEPVELICGGFPCQPHSLAGKRKASADERDLWGEFARIIRELKPKWVVAENVPGLLSSESGRFFGRVLRDLASSGYDAEWRIISAFDVGAPHQRDRLWIVANTNSSRESQSERLEQNKWGRIIHGSSKMADANGTRCEGYGNGTERREEKHAMPSFSSWWEAEPNVGRVVNGLSKRVDRLRCLGNAVVPQIVELIGNEILRIN